MGCQGPTSKQKWDSDSKEYEEVPDDPGVEDKRLLVVETEFSSVLKMLLRQGNILGEILRQAWDSGNLRLLTKNNAAKATGAHISLIGHITGDELLRCLSETDQANGFGNRILWPSVRRSKYLPDDDTQVTVRKILVDTESQALELGFVSSPTIRVNGKDIALELRESSCASCGGACGCEGNIDCRVWIYEGKEHTVAPVPMIVDAILSAVYGAKEGMVVPQQAGAVPDNLKRFFAARTAKVNSSCCDVKEQAVCCEPAQKSSCCGPLALEKGAPPASCGCR